MSYTVTGSIPPTAANWTESLSIPQFQSNLGTLTSVTLTLNGSMSTTLIAGNITGSTFVPTPDPSSGSAGVVAQFGLQDSGGSLSGLSIVSPMEGYSFAAGGSQSWSLSTADSSSAVYTDSSTLGEFTGPGNITLDAAGTAFTNQVNTGGVSYAGQNTISSLTADVTYTYSASVPEPSTIALLGVGIVTLLAYRRARHS